MNKMEVKLIDLEVFIAKDDGSKLLFHLNDVSRFAVLIAEQSMQSTDKIDEDQYGEIIEAARLSGLLHDIAKFTEGFQIKLGVSSDKDEEG